MEIRLNNIVIIISFLCLFISCKNEAKEKNTIVQTTINNDTTQVDFLNKKYFKGYTMLVDASTPAEHPYYSYLDCKKEGYFAVHFIPKTNTLVSFWKERYFKENKYEYDDAETANKIISHLLDGKNDFYNIFCFHITKKYIDESSYCTEESISLKKESFADFYIYNSKTKKWIFLKSIKVNILPTSADNTFFVKNFPDIIAQKQSLPSSEIDSVSIPKTSLWAIDCQSEKYISIKFNINNAQFSIPDRFAMNSKLKKIGTNKYELYFTDFPPIIALPDNMEVWDNMDNKKPVGVIEFTRENKLSLTWFGFYHKKLKKNIETENPFDSKKETTDLIKCSDR